MPFGHHALRHRKDMALHRLFARSKLRGKWQFLPVTRVGEKLDWGKLDLHGTPITSIPGTFYLDYRENGQRFRRAIGDHPLNAKVALGTQRSVLKLRDARMVVDDARSFRSIVLSLATYPLYFLREAVSQGG